MKAVSKGKTVKEVGAGGGSPRIQTRSLFSICFFLGSHTEMNLPSLALITSIGLWWP